MQQKNKYYLQMINQLRRNVFNLDFKREILVAKTHVKNFFFFNSHLVSMVQNLAHFLNMCILLILPVCDETISSTLVKSLF